MPPAPIRRPVTVTFWLVVSGGVVILSPALLALAYAARAVTGRPQPLIAARLIVAYFGYELGVLIGCGALWLLAGGRGGLRSRRLQVLHWRLLGWFVGGLERAGRRTLAIEIAANPSPEAARALESDAPLIVFSRHAGPGDTVFIVDQLISRFGRRPSVAFKEALALDPCVDLLAHRLPHALLDTSDREECEARIEQVTARLGARGALLLFPEGANFTFERRRSALGRLRRKGRRESAARAANMTHVLPPHPSGALAALRARGRADIVFAAHTGLGLAAYPRQWWRDPPIGRTLRTRMWLVRSDDVPAGEDDRVRWLYDWWQRIDNWIAECDQAA